VTRFWFREGRSLVPTPHALELAASLQEALDLIDSALRASRGFDPQAAERTAIENDGIDRILFASDFPFYDMAEVRKQVEDAVGREAAQRIYANRVPGLRLPTPAVSAYADPTSPADRRSRSLRNRPGTASPAGLAYAGAARSARLAV
jgi:hypothetical protein